jgi:hypothetical protein
MWNSYRLEVTLVKREQGLMWQKLTKEETQGEEILDPALVEEMHLKLAHLCSDKEVLNMTSLLLMTKTRISSLLTLSHDTIP